MADIKVPRKQQAAWLVKALDSTPRDGQWHKLKTMALSSAEQTARGLNGPAGSSGWVFGYKRLSDNGELRSELWVQWV